MRGVVLFGVQVACTIVLWTGNVVVAVEQEEHQPRFHPSIWVALLIQQRPLILAPTFPYLNISWCTSEPTTPSQVTVLANFHLSLS